MDNIKISFEADTPLAAIEILKAIQNYKKNGSFTDKKTKAPPAMPQKAEETKAPPPVTQKAEETKAPPPVPQKTEKFDTGKIRADINDELTRIMNGGGDARSYLQNKGYSGTKMIPENELVSFLKMLKGE